MPSTSDLAMPGNAECALAAVQAQGLPGGGYDLTRTARMTSFGLLLYGPAQHYWYGMLDRRFAAKNVSNFLCKVIPRAIA